MESEVSHLKIDIKTQQIITSAQAWHYKIIPKSVDESIIKFYIDDAIFNKSILDELQILLGKKIEVDLVNSESIFRALNSYYRRNNIVDAKKQK